VAAAPWQRGVAKHMLWQGRQQTHGSMTTHVAELGSKLADNHRQQLPLRPVALDRVAAKGLGEAAIKIRARPPVRRKSDRWSVHMRRQAHLHSSEFKQMMPAQEAPHNTEMRFLLIAAKQGPAILFCMPNRTKCILSVSVMTAVPWTCTPPSHTPMRGSHDMRSHLGNLSRPSFTCVPSRHLRACSHQRFGLHEILLLRHST
jgi:hypothetical protein